MSDSRSSSKNQNGKKTPLEWARFWFHKPARFHRVQDPARWTFTEQDVIAFLCQAQGGDADLEEADDR